MKGMRNFYVRPHKSEEKENRIMTGLVGNILGLDLFNDQKARDCAFSYAMSIIEERAELADSILSVIETNEKRE